MKNARKRLALGSRVVALAMFTTASALLPAQDGHKTPASAQTIGVPFARIPTVETRRRMWVLESNQSAAVNGRDGTTDRTNTELVGDDRQGGIEVVTPVTGVGDMRGPLGIGPLNNPLLPQQDDGGRDR
jgi:hypothetical protein